MMMKRITSVLLAVTMILSQNCFAGASVRNAADVIADTEAVEAIAEEVVAGEDAIVEEIQSEDQTVVEETASEESESEDVVSEETTSEEITSDDIEEPVITVEEAEEADSNDKATDGTQLGGEDTEEKSDGTFKYIENSVGVLIQQYIGTSTNVVIPEKIGDLNVIGIRKDAFSSKQIASVEIKAPIKVVYANMFENQRSLTKVILPESVTEIDEKAFYGCSSLASITLPSKLVSIKDYAFYSSGLKELTLPATVREVASYSISYCTKLERLDMSAVNCSSAENFVLGTYACRYDSALKEVKFPKAGLKTIPYCGFYNCTSLLSIEIPESVITIDTDAFYGDNRLESVTFAGSSKLSTISSYAFQKCSKLSALNMPNTVKSLGSYAFSECVAMKSLHISETLSSISSYSFYGCENLSTVIIPGSVKSIASNAFEDCLRLTGVKIPSTVTSIGTKAFEGAPALTIYGTAKTAAETYANDVNNDNKFSTGELVEVVLKDGSTTDFDYLYDQKQAIIIKNKSTNSAVVVPEKLNNLPVTAIKKDVFKGNSSITSVKINAPLEKLPKEFFYNCTKLSACTLPNTIKEIKDLAFQSTGSLKSITIPKSLRKIGQYAFRYSGLTSIDLTPMASNTDAVTIDSYAFYSNANLTSVKLPEGLKNIPSCCFSNCSSLKDVQISSTVNTISSSAFYYCYSLEDIVIPAGVKTIGSSAFDRCSKLTNIDFTKSTLERVESGAFNDCDSLQKVVFPDTLNYVGSGAFMDCIELQAVYIPNNSKLSMYSNAFAITDSFGGKTNNGNCPALTIYGVEGSYAQSYANSNKIPFSSLEFDASKWNNIDTEANYVYYTDKGNAVLTKYIGQDVDVVVPETVDDYPVVALKKTLFKGNTRIKSVVIEAEITEVVPSFFESCTALTSVTLPDTVKKINSFAFRYTNSLKSINLPEGLVTISSYAFYNSGIEELAFPSTVTYIDSNAFYGSSIKQVDLSGVTSENVSLGSEAFRNCLKLTSVKLPKPLKAVSSGLFYGCKALTTVEFKENLTSIGSQAFYDCTALKEVQLASTKVTYISDKAFYNCKELKVFNPSKTLLSIGTSAFEGCVSLRRTVLPQGATTLSDRAFRCCQEMSLFFVPTTVNKMGSNVFQLDEFLVVRVAPPNPVVIPKLDNEEIPVEVITPKNPDVVYPLPSKDPKITSVSPLQVAYNASATVTVKGTDFYYDLHSYAKIDGKRLTISHDPTNKIDATKFTFTVPAGLAPGKYEITIHDCLNAPAKGLSITKEFEVLPPPEPIITKVSPTTAKEGVSQYVTVDGANFTYGANAYIMIGKTKAVIGKTNRNSGHFNFTVPAASIPGEYELVAFDSMRAGATGKNLGVKFTITPKAPDPAPVITSVSPVKMEKGTSGANVLVKVTGKYFKYDASKPSYVEIGGNKFPILSGATSTTFKFNVPNNSLDAGEYDMTVYNALNAGETGLKLAQKFTVTLPPSKDPKINTISQVSQLYNKNTVKVTMTGVNFSYKTGFKVMLGDYAGSILQKNSTTIIFNVPAKLPVGEYPIKLVNGFGVDEFPTEYVYEVKRREMREAEITSISPTTAIEKTAVTVTVSGTNFDYADDVTPYVMFGDEKLQLTKQTSTYFTFKVPSTYTVGEYPISVYNMLGVYEEGKEIGSFEFTEKPKVLPIISTITPSSIYYKTTKTTVKISGYRFKYVTGTKVKVGDTVCTILQKNSTMLMFSVPGKLPLGKYPIVVYNGFGAEGEEGYDTGLTFDVIEKVMRDGQVTGITPGEVVKGTTATVAVTGTEFDYSDVVKPYFMISGDETHYPLKSGTTTRCSFEIPNTLDYGTYEVTAYYMLGAKEEGKVCGTFDIIPKPKVIPIISSMTPSSAKYSSTGIRIAFKGYKFTYNTGFYVSVAGQKCTILQKNSTNLIVRTAGKIPAGTYEVIVYNGFSAGEEGYHTGKTITIK